MRATRTEHGVTHTADYEVKDGVVFWLINGNVAPIDACEAYGILVDRAKQQAALDASNAAFAAEYRKRGPRPLSAEERYELRAAFGPGTEVVDAIGGWRFRT